MAVAHKDNHRNSRRVYLSEDYSNVVDDYCFQCHAAAAAAAEREDGPLLPDNDFLRHHGGTWRVGTCMCCGSQIERTRYRPPTGLNLADFFYFPLDDSPKRKRKRKRKHKQTLPTPKEARKSAKVSSSSDDEADYEDLYPSSDYEDSGAVAVYVLNATLAGGGPILYELPSLKDGHLQAIQRYEKDVHGLVHGLAATDPTKRARGLRKAQEAAVTAWERKNYRAAMSDLGAMHTFAVPSEFFTTIDMGRK